jgi:hypothetical protein
MTTFATVVGQLSRGMTNEQLNNHLKAVSKAVMDTNGVGEVTLKLKIKPNGNGGVTITDEIKTKVPELARGVSMFFTDDEGNLLQRDPRQGDMFKGVDKDTGEIKSDSN